ncbi:MAG: DUF2785 domain-containing protein [Symbiobacteriia bacterium]
MEKAFWRMVLANEAAVPEGSTASEYLPNLMAGLGSTDPELRDSLCNEVLYCWITAGRFSAEELARMVDQLRVNLTAGVGEGENDQIFLRTFSALVLRYILLYDARAQFLAEGDVNRVFEASLQYLASEADLRGYVPAKGWAHSVAHTADLLLALAEHPRVGTPDLKRLLYAISAKVLAPTQYPFVAHEGFRLSRVVIGVWRRDLLPMASILDWLHALGDVPESEAFAPGRDEVRYHNAEAFLSALHMTLRHVAQPGEVSDSLLAAVDVARLPYTPL